MPYTHAHTTPPYAWRAHRDGIAGARAGLHAICELVAQAKGWSLSHTAAVTRDNYTRFYADKPAKP